MYNKKYFEVINVHLPIFGLRNSNIIKVVITGAFGLTFKGIFSQPSRFVDGFWVPAADYMTPKDPQMNLMHLQEMAEYVMNLENTELPKIIPFNPCSCKPKTQKRKEVW